MEKNQSDANYRVNDMENFEVWYNRSWYYTWYADYFRISSSWMAWVLMNKYPNGLEPVYKHLQTDRQMNKWIVRDRQRISIFFLNFTCGNETKWHGSIQLHQYTIHSYFYFFKGAPGRCFRSVLLAFVVEVLKSLLPLRNFNFININDAY